MQIKIPPPVDTPGYWILRDAFNGSKSFGVFVCEDTKCKKQWISAHANKEFRMGCNICEKRVLPTYMWVNTHKSDKDKDVTSKQKPHDSKRCEACEKGLCIIPARRRQWPFPNLQNNTHRQSECITDIQSVEITIEPEPSPRRVDDLEIKRNLLREKIKKSFLDLG